MIFSPARRDRLTYLTGSQASDGITKRPIVVESRPEYATFQLEGTHIQYSVAWKHIFQFAKTQYKRSLRLEAGLRCKAAAAEKSLRRKQARR